MQSADHDTAFPLLVLDILNNTLERSDNPALLGEYLTQQICDLTGARSVILAQRSQKTGQTAHRVVSISQASQVSLAVGPELQQIIQFVHTQTRPVFWLPGDSSETSSLLQKMELCFSMGIPLISGDSRLGCFLILGLQDSSQNATLQELFKTLAPIVALVLRNSLLSEDQEQERQQAEEALRASEEKLRAFFASGLFGTRTSRVDGPIYEANDEFLRTVGYSRQDLEEGRMDWRAMTPPEYLPQADLRIAEAQERGFCTPFEKQYICKDGSRVWVLIGFILFGDARQNMISFTIDINQRKQESERMQAILSNIPVMINFISPEGRLVWGNRCWEVTLGVPYEEAQKLDVIKTFHPDAPGDQEAARRQIEEADGQWRDSKLTTPDGRVLDTIWANIRLSDGSHIGIGQNITERRKIEAARRASEERFTSFMDHLPAMAFIKDQDSNVVFLNRYNMTFFGWGETVLGQHTSALVGKEVAARRVIEDRMALAGKRVERVETLTDWNGVVHTFKMIKFPIVSQDNPVLLGGLSIDISDQMRAEEEVRKLNLELEQRVAARTTQLQTANRELEAFSYSVSHDLRAPLRAIDGFSRILLEDFSAELQPEARRFLGLVRSNTQQMGKLVDDLLVFSRLHRQLLHKQLIQPADEVSSALDSLRHEREGRQVEITVGNLPPCWADPALIRQVFVNLLSNALKFSRSQPVAKIEVGFIPGQPPGEPLSGQSVAGIYFIRDNGVGFDMRFAQKLFTAFQRLHRAEDYEGTGIGLAIVQRIINRHGGKTWAEAQTDAGATFYFSLPEGSDAYE